MMPQLSDRQKQILGLVIRGYIENGTPLGSKTLVKQYRLSFSSATVRNEMARLTEMGYIGQQHTSGGRVPTEQGYRYFVQRLVGEFDLPVFEQQTIKHQFHQARLEMDQWMRLAAAVLANTSQGAAFVTAPRTRFGRFKRVELISTRDRLVLMIVVLYGGQVTQQMLTLASPLSQQRLRKAADEINRRFDGYNSEEISTNLHQLDDLEGDVTSLILDITRRADRKAIDDIYRDGLGNILDDDGTRTAVKMLEERSLLNDVVTDAFGNRDDSGVQVIIGGEGRWEELKHCTLILSRYGVADVLAGEVAVVGALRMPYGRNISAVRYVSNIMSSFVQDYYAEDPPEREDK